MSDLRKYLRLDTSFDVLFHVLTEKQGSEGRAQALDAGAGGVKIFTDKKLSKGTQLNLSFFIGNEKQDSEVSAVGEVVWVRELKVGGQELNRYEVGLQFVKIETKDRDKIFKYVYKRLAAQDRVRNLVRRCI